jgi:hypothetical protein
MRSERERAIRQVVKTGVKTGVDDYLDKNEYAEGSRERSERDKKR